MQLQPKKAANSLPIIAAARLRDNVMRLARRSAPAQRAKLGAKPAEAMLGRVRHLDAVMGGDGTVTSDPGKGSVFTVRLPS